MNASPWSVFADTAWSYLVVAIGVKWLLAAASNGAIDKKGLTSLSMQLLSLKWLPGAIANSPSVDPGVAR
jgi:hypothetical protein